MISHFEANLAHTAIFGWPCDELTPAALFAQADITKATRFLINTERAHWELREDCKMWPTDKWVLTEYRGYRIWVNLADPFLGFGILHEDWEVAEVDFMVANVRACDTVLDIGTNVGVYTLAAANAVGPSGRVYGFEPMPKTYEMVNRSIAENGFENRCEIVRTALGDQVGTVLFHQSPSNPGSSHVSNDGYAVPITRLDTMTFHGRITFLKVDIEGFEPLFLKGAKQTIASHRPLILSEFFPRALREVGNTSPQAFLATIEALGYESFLFEGAGFGRPITQTSVQDIEGVETPLNLILRPAS